ncbi:MAG: hypothetical protein Q7K37_00010 [Dehalococcoidia bacterium]|nr:hypothetical protein [Dehalococcoidia bacterium]
MPSLARGRRSAAAGLDAGRRGPCPRLSVEPAAEPLEAVPPSIERRTAPEEPPSAAPAAPDDTTPRAAGDPLVRDDVPEGRAAGVAPAAPGWPDEADPLGPKAPAAPTGSPAVIPRVAALNMLARSANGAPERVEGSGCRSAPAPPDPAPAEPTARGSDSRCATLGRGAEAAPRSAAADSLDVGTARR